MVKAVAALAGGAIAAMVSFSAQAGMFSCGDNQTLAKWVVRHVSMPVSLMEDLGTWHPEQDSSPICFHNPISGSNTAIINYRYTPIMHPMSPKCARVLVSVNGLGDSSYMVVSRDTNACHWSWQEQILRGLQRFG